MAYLSSMKTNQPTKLPRELPPHFFRHIISGIIVFSLGLVADVTIVEIIHNRKHTVIWANGEIQRDYIFHASTTSPDFTATNGVEIGYLDNGQITWRTAQPAAASAPTTQTKL